MRYLKQIKVRYKAFRGYAGELEARNIQERLRKKGLKRTLPTETREYFPQKYITVEKAPRFMRDADGTIYGIVHDGKVYLNGNKLNRNTPMHESAHLLWDWFKDNAPELHRAGLDMMEGARYLRRAKNSEFYQKQAERLSQNGATSKKIEDFYRDGALAMAVGDRGEKLSLHYRVIFRCTFYYTPRGQNENGKQNNIEWVLPKWEKPKKLSCSQGCSS